MQTLELNRTSIKSDAINPLLTWLSQAFEEIESEGLEIVDSYWRDLRLEGKNQPYYPKVTLGLRIRRRQGGSFSLEWFGIGTLATKRRYIAKHHIPKGKAETYSIKRLMRGQPNWIMPLVEDTEYRLTQIRRRHVQLSKIREALAGWYSHSLEKPLRGREMIDEYRMLIGFNPLSQEGETSSPHPAFDLERGEIFSPNAGWPKTTAMSHEYPRHSI